MDKLMSLRSLLTPVRVLASQQRFAGHAKWQNIAHTKRTNDQAKGQRTSRHCANIKRACALGTDPKINKVLQDAITAALKAQVARATIDRQVERAKNVQIKQELIEIMGPGGSFLLFEVETANISSTRRDIKKLLRKIPGTGMMKEGAAKIAFTERGVVLISRKDKSGKMIDKDRAEDIAIEVGAEEVCDESEPESESKSSDAAPVDPEDGPAWTFYTMARDVQAVKLRLDGMNDIEVISAETRYLPFVRVPISPEDVQQAATLIEKMQELEEVTSCYDNIKPPEA